MNKTEEKSIKKADETIIEIVMIENTPMASLMGCNELVPLPSRLKESFIGYLKNDDNWIGLDYIPRQAVLEKLTQSDYELLPKN